MRLSHYWINVIRKAAPDATIAFNTRPDDSADAAARLLAVAKPACIVRRPTKPAVADVSRGNKQFAAALD